VGVRAGYTFASTFIAHAGIGAGAPLHGVRVTDAEARITGLGGPLIFASAGGAWSF
jgi:hypothetical protein